MGLKQLETIRGTTTIPSKYQAGQLVTGKVTKITNFGVFVGLEDGLEGLLHISELADHKVENPEDVVKVGDEIEVKILRVDTEERKIGLSRKRVEWAEEDEAAAAGDSTGALSGASGEAAARRAARAPDDLKGGLGDSGPLIKTEVADEPEDAPAAEGDEAPAAEGDEAPTAEGDEVPSSRRRRSAAQPRAIETPPTGAATTKPVTARLHDGKSDITTDLGAKRTEVFFCARAAC